MRVVFVDDAVSFGGAQIAAANMAKMVAATLRYDVDFFCTEKNERLIEQLRHVPGISVHTDGYDAKPLFLVTHLVFLWKLPSLAMKLRKLDGNVIIVNMAGLEFGWLYIYAAKLIGLRTICWLHNPFRYVELVPSRGWRNRLNLARDALAQQFVKLILPNLYIVSGSSRDYLLQRLGRQSGIKVMGNIVFPPNADSTKFDLSSIVMPRFDAKKIAVVPGRIDFGPKAQDRIVRCLDEMRTRGIAVVFVGDGADLPMLRDCCASYENAFFVGWKESIVPYLKGADVILLPSRFESQPLILLEVLFLHVPVVISAIPAFREMLDGRFVADFEDPVSVCETIATVCAMDQGDLTASYEAGRQLSTGSNYLGNVQGILNGV